jgi:DNA transposition AAA+ family ATPase
MRPETAMTKPLMLALQAMDDILERPHGVEGMMTIVGVPGAGKTTAVGKIADSFDGIYLRAVRCWTTTTMLGAIAVELGAPREGKGRLHRRIDMLAYIEKALEHASHRPLIIDEADYLTDNMDMLDAVRDIYDLFGNPIVLVGMESFTAKIQAQSSGRFARRVTQWIEFGAVDSQDARKIAETCCEVALADDLLRYLHQQSSANVGRFVTGLSKIEAAAKRAGKDTVSLDDWGGKPLFYDQPVFGKNKVKRKPDDEGQDK